MVCEFFELLITSKLAENLAWLKISSKGFNSGTDNSARTYPSERLSQQEERGLIVINNFVIKFIKLPNSIPAIMVVYYQHGIGEIVEAVSAVLKSRIRGLGGMTI